MITATVEKKHGAATLRAKISAPTIGRAVKLAGGGARLVLPIDGTTFFAAVTGEGVDYAAMTTEQVEAAHEAGLPGAYEAYLERLKVDLGEEAFEVYALENCLV